MFWLGFVKTFEGWTLAERGRYDEAVETIREGIRELEERNTSMFRPESLALLAEAYAGCGRRVEGLETLDEALAISERTSEYWITPELHRLKGELLARGGEAESVAAQACFESGLQAARDANGKGFELRAATSLARFLSSRGESAQARELLAPVYRSFREGFETEDLVEASALLEALE